MTIKKLLQDLDKKSNAYPPEIRAGYIDMTTDAMEVWNNDACKGYALMAAESIGLNRHQISDLIDSINWHIFNKTIEDAEKYYAQSEI